MKHLLFKIQTISGFYILLSEETTSLAPMFEPQYQTSLLHTETNHHKELPYEYNCHEMDIYDNRCNQYPYILFMPTNQQGSQKIRCGK